MLTGEYHHTLDEKRRLSLPAKLRPPLGKTVVLTAGLEHTLWVLAKREWQQVAQTLVGLPMGSEASRRFARFLFASATEVDVDRNGRMLITEHLARYAELKDRVVMAGVGKRLEIWDENRWNNYIKETAAQADNLASHLGELGLL
jgi:MraZ protein